MRFDIDYSAGTRTCRRAQPAGTVDSRGLPYRQCDATPLRNQIRASGGKPSKNRFGHHTPNRARYSTSSIMEFEIWFTIDATNEAAQMCRGWSYWPRFFVENLQGIVLVGAMLIGGSLLVAETLFTPTRSFQVRNWGAVGSCTDCWILVAPPKDIQTATRMLATLNPLKLKFESNGLHTFENDGANNFVPWSNYDGFREGKLVLLLREAKTRQYRVIPKETLPDTDVEQLRSAVRSRLPEIQ